MAVGSRHRDAPAASAPASGPRRDVDVDAAARRRTMLTGALAVLFFMLVLALAGWLVVSRIGADYSQQRTAAQADRAAARLTDAHRSDALDAARDYNRRLFEGGQATLGAIQDPTTAIRLQRAAHTDSGSSGSSGSGSGAAGASALAAAGRTDADLVAADQDARSRQDAEYNGLLDIGGGIMGTLSIPAIDATMPIYHGTSNEAMSAGAGHLYGTSLPVGGANTHAVLTSHRGLVAAELFTRLDEMQVGDVFSITVMNEKLNYKVDGITVVEPDDVSRLTITPGEDRVTLLTCTPYGVNTQRLLVSALRTTDDAPVAATAVSPVRTGNAWRWAWFAAAVTAMLGLIYLTFSRLPRTAPIRHRAARAVL